MVDFWREWRSVRSMEGSIDISACLRPGVYLLSRGGRVMYVGQSKCPLARIAAHRSLARKRVPWWLPIRGVIFDKAEVIPCHPDRIDALERGLIEFYRPPNNRQHNPDAASLPPPTANPFKPGLRL